MKIDKILDINSELTLHTPDGTIIKGKITEISDDEFIFTPESALNISPEQMVKVSDGHDACHAKVMDRKDNAFRLRMDFTVKPGKERRQDVRIYDKIYYSVKFLAHAADKGKIIPDALLKIRANRLIIDSFLKGKYGYPGIDDLPRTSEPPFSQALWEVNRKLDLLIHIFLAEDFVPLIKTSPKDVNISASGIKFISSSPLEKGDLVEVDMILPMMPLLFLRVLAEVIRTKELTTYDATIMNYAVAAHFVQLDPESKEDIIRYLFKRQREILRDRKH